MTSSKFIVRVYGIYIDKKRGILVSDEFIKGMHITKFPGGGLKYGESTIDCLKREMQEETNTAFKIGNHFYTTDFFVESAFHPGHQVLSVYYLMEPEGSINFVTVDFPYLGMTDKEGAQVFRYLDREKISENDFTLEIDRYVARLLKEWF